MKDFAKLESEISSDGKMQREISRTIQSSSNCYLLLEGLSRNKYIPINHKKVMCKSYYTPILTYGSETWEMKKINKKLGNRSQVSQMKFLHNLILTKCMAYGTRRFNAAFTRALQ